MKQKIQSVDLQQVIIIARGLFVHLRTYRRSYPNGAQTIQLIYTAKKVTTPLPS